MSGGIPLSPEEIARMNSDEARARAYYGGAGISSPVDAPPPPPDPSLVFGPPAGPPPPPEPAPPASPPAPIRPVGAQVSDLGTSQGRGAVLGRVPPPEPPASTAPKPSVVPSFARGPAAPDTEAPPVPQGASDAAARALAHYSGVGGKPPTKGLGGGPGNPDPFGIKAARKGVYGTYDEEEAAMRRGAENEQGRADTVAQGQALIAQQQQEAAERQAVEAAHAAELFRQHMDESQRQLDDIRAQKVDPNRLYADNGSKAIAVVGGVLGGLYQGLNHMEKNPFLEDMNRAIQQDIGLQERELSRKERGVEQKQNLLGQMRSIYKDEATARLQAENLMLEGAKSKLAADAATYESPAIKARADQAITQLDRQQKQLKLGDAMQAAAAAQAAAGAAERQRQTDFENALKLEDARTKRIAAEKSGTNHEPPLRSRFVATGKDPVTGEPTGYLDRNAEGAKERENSRIAAQQLIGKIDRALEIRNNEGFLGRTLNRADPNDKVQIYAPEWQTQLKSLSAEMTTDWAHAKKLGALSDSDRQLANDAIGDLTSRGSQSEVRLKELRRTLEESLKREDEAAAGTRVRMRADESIEPIGGANAPTNSRTGSSVRREAP